MVYIISEDAEKFPNTSALILRQILAAVDETDIMFAFLKGACPNYTLKDLNDIMSKITSPFLVGFVPRITYTYKSNDDEFHYYDQETLTIHFGMIRASQINDEPHNLGYQKYTKAVVLHELVHHVDYILDGKFEDYEIVGSKKKRIKGVQERGHYFEKLAFGGTVTMSGGVIQVEDAEE